jgi:hypothetical protein
MSISVWTTDRSKGTCEMAITFSRPHKTECFPCGVTLYPWCGITSREALLRFWTVFLSDAQALPQRRVVNVLTFVCMYNFVGLQHFARVGHSATLFLSYFILKYNGFVLYSTFYLHLFHYRFPLLYKHIPLSPSCLLGTVVVMFCY